MQDLTVALVQLATIWESAAQNRDSVERLLAGLPTVDLIVLPETFTTGFSTDSPHLAEPMDGPTLAWMKALAARTSSVVTGSLLIQDEGRCFNRLLWVTPEGAVQSYDKRHLFSLMGEDRNFVRGSERKIFTLHGWRFAVQICYDLRFPVWCRNRNDYDVLLLVANWPAKRALAWRTLSHARAIENQAYVVALNRVGQDASGLAFGGASLVIDPLGETRVELDGREQVSVARLSAEALMKTRESFPFLKDSDSFTIE